MYRGFHLFSLFRGVSTAALCGVAMGSSAHAADQPGGVTFSVPVSAVIVASVGAVRPLSSALTDSLNRTSARGSLALPPLTWVRSTGTRDLFSGLMLASASDSGVSTPAAISRSAFSSLGQSTGFAPSAVMTTEGSRFVVASRAAPRSPGYISVAMTYE
jgi:hypothetical protein